MSLPLRARRFDPDHPAVNRVELCHCQIVPATVVHVARRQCAACATNYHPDRESVALTLIEHGRQLVLIRRTKAPLAGYWAPPAGHVEFGEAITHAAIREAREESGLNVALDSLAGVYRQPDHTSGPLRMVISAYRGHSMSGIPSAGDDAGDIKLFDAGELPVQPPPRHGTPTDYWVYDVIQELIEPWRRSQRRALRLLKQ